MNRTSPLLLASWSITTVALALAGAAMYVHLSAPVAAPASPPPAATTVATTPPPSAPPPPPPAPLPVADLSQGDVSLPDVVARVLPSVVNIASATRSARRSPYGGPPEEMVGQSLGSGVVVSEDGLVVTNNHVVENGSRITVHFSDGHEYPALVVGTDEMTDVALLRVTPPTGETPHFVPLAYGDSSALRLGDTVLAIGNPFGVGQTVTMGIVSAVGRADMGIAEYEDFIQTDASINPGNSGGALVSMRGELIGINTAILSGGGGPGGHGGSVGIGFAIPTAMVQPIVESLLAHGQVTRGWLGVSIQDLTPDLAHAMHATSTQGVLVTDVEPGSPGAQAGLLRGDIVEQLDTEHLTSPAQLRNLVATRGAGAHVQLTLERSGERRTVPVTLGARPGQRVAPRTPAPPDPRTPPRTQPPIDPWAVPPSFGVPGQPLFPPGWGGPNAPPGWGSGSATPDPRAPAPQASAPPPSGAPATTDVGGLAVADLDATTRALFQIPSGITRGAVVVQVTRGSAGDAAGVDVGDVIVETNGTGVASATDFQRAYAAASGSAVILLRRGGGSTYVLMR
ncbi:MAG: trypsin-like peptidase domain-containing protein [Sandaracinus sp.]